MGKWLRLDAQHSSHPKFEDAGHWGWSVALAAWCIAKAYDCYDGEISKWWRPKSLARWMCMEPSVEGLECVSKGMVAALQARLVVQRDDGVYIHGWTEYQRDHTAAERAKRYRDKKNVTRDDSDGKPVTRDDSDGKPVTRDVTRQDRTGQDRTHERDVARDVIKTSSRSSSLDDVLDHYCTGYQGKYGKQALVAGSGRRAVEALLAGPPPSPPRTVDECCSLVDAYLDLDDAYVSQRGYPLELLPSRVNELQAGGGDEYDDPMLREQPPRNDIGDGPPPTAEMMEFNPRGKGGE